MKVLLAAIICVFGLSAHAQKADVDVAIVFVVDASDSIKVREWSIIAQGHSSAIMSPDVLEAVADGPAGRIAISVVAFAETAEVKLGWTLVDLESADAAAAAVRAALATRMPPDEYATSITAGLRAAQGLVLALPYAADKVVVDVVGDGKHNKSGDPPPDADRDMLVSLGATVNGMPLVLAPSDTNVVEYYAEHVVGGLAAFNLPVERVEEFPSMIRQKMVMELF